MGPTFCCSLSMMTHGWLPNCRWGKDSQFHPLYYILNHETVRSWEWVTAVEVFSLLNRWRALWWKCRVFLYILNVINSSQCLLVGFHSSKSLFWRLSPFQHIYFHLQWRDCSYFSRWSQVDSKQSFLLQVWICPWGCTLHVCESNTWYSLVFQSTSGE